MSLSSFPACSASSQSSRGSYGPALNERLPSSRMCKVTTGGIQEVAGEMVWLLISLLHCSWNGFLGTYHHAGTKLLRFSCSPASQRGRFLC